MTVAHWRVVACGALALVLLGGAAPDPLQDYVSGNVDAAQEQWRRAAEAGDTRAQLYLGTSLLADERNAPAGPPAIAWFRKAALAGDADAQFRLGAIHAFAESEPDRRLDSNQVKRRAILAAADPDHSAAEWFHQAADQGHEGALFVLKNLFDGTKFDALAIGPMNHDTLYIEMGLSADGSAPDRAIFGLDPRYTSFLPDAKRTAVTVGAADSRIWTGPNPAWLMLGPGRNSVAGGGGNLLVEAGNGDDSVVAGAGDTLIYAGRGTDKIDANAYGSLTVYAGLGSTEIKQAPGSPRGSVVLRLLQAPGRVSMTGFVHGKSTIDASALDTGDFVALQAGGAIVVDATGTTVRFPSGPTLVLAGLTDLSSADVLFGRPPRPAATADAGPARVEVAAWVDGSATLHVKDGMAWWAAGPDGRISVPGRLRPWRWDTPPLPVKLDVPTDGRAIVFQPVVCPGVCSVERAPSADNGWEAVYRVTQTSRAAHNNRPFWVTVVVGSDAVAAAEQHAEHLSLPSSAQGCSIEALLDTVPATEAGPRPDAAKSFAGRNLEMADFRGRDLSGANFAGADLRGARFQRANLTDADLTEANLGRANLIGAKFTRAQLRKAKFQDVVLAGVIEDCAARAHYAALGSAPLPAPVKITPAMLTDMTEADFVGADIRGVDLRGAILRRAKFGHINLEGAVFAGDDLSGTDLSDAELKWSDFTGADLSGANLERLDLGPIDLTGANLAGADLRQARIDGLLAGANLRGADLGGADLRQGDLRHVLAGADLRGADLTNVDLRELQMRYREPIPPDGDRAALLAKLDGEIRRDCDAFGKSLGRRCELGQISFDERMTDDRGDQYPGTGTALDVVVRFGLIAEPSAVSPP